MEWCYVWWPWLTSQCVARVYQHQLSFLLLYSAPPWATQSCKGKGWKLPFPVTLAGLLHNSFALPYKPWYTLHMPPGSIPGLGDWLRDVVYVWTMVIKPKLILKCVRPCSTFRPHLVTCQVFFIVCQRANVHIGTGIQCMSVRLSLLKWLYILPDLLHHLIGQSFYF